MKINSHLKSVNYLIENTFCIKEGVTIKTHKKQITLIETMNAFVVFSSFLFSYELHLVLKVGLFCISL